MLKDPRWDKLEQQLEGSRPAAPVQHEPHECRWVQHWRMHPPSPAQRESWRLNND